MRHNQKLFDYSHFRYPKDIANFASFELFKHSEVPAWIHNYHVGMLKALRYENMYLKEGSDSQEKVPFLLKTRKLVSEEAKYVAGRFAGFKNVNLINLGVDGFNDSLDLITPLLEQGKLAKYVMASQSSMINSQWVNTAQLLASNYNVELQGDTLEANFDMQSYPLAFSSLVPKDKQTANLFFLGDSVLGNHINPTRVLQNIHKSMASGDFLLISQAIYKPGSEGFWMGSFINFLTLEKHFGVEKEFSQNLSPDYPTDTIWEEKNGFRGIKLRVEIQEPIKFGQVKLEEKQQVDIFRTTMFTEAELKKIAFDLEFKVLQIVYGDSMDNALLFLQKD
jgi:hypothetical protein